MLADKLLRAVFQLTSKEQGARAGGVGSGRGRGGAGRAARDWDLSYVAGCGTSIEI